MSIWRRFRGCKHERLSFPIITSEDRGRGEVVMPHVTCLECGCEFRYDWERMHRRHERLPLMAIKPGPKRTAA